MSPWRPLGWHYFSCTALRWVRCLSPKRCQSSRCHYCSHPRGWGMHSMGTVTLSLVSMWRANHICLLSS